MPHSQVTLTNTEDSGGTVAPPPAPITYRILQENAFILLTEDGKPLRKEQNT